MNTDLKKKQNYQSIRPDIKLLEEKIIGWRRELHQYPELGFLEAITAKFIKEKLEEIGLEVKTGIAKTGLTVLIEGDLPGPTLAIRADMDALPVQEENSLSYSSRHQGIMHACGHDGHMAIALGTACYLVDNRHKLAGKVKIIFQPAEEGPGGAKPMIAEGVLKAPTVDAIIGLHLWNNLSIGLVGVRSGPMMAAVEIFNLTIQGKGGHGAMPEQTVDSIVVASQIVNALQTIVSRNINPIESVVVTVGKFQSGSAPNVIAASAKLSGTVRYFNPQFKGYFKERIESIIAGICQGQGAIYELDYQEYYPPVVNDPQITALVRSVAIDFVETELGVVPECQTMAAEDMSFFLQEVPGCYFFLGSANKEKHLDYPHHHPKFNFDEEVLTAGIEIFIRCVEQFTKNKLY
jgi:amidohydrolase